MKIQTKNGPVAINEVFVHLFGSGDGTLVSSIDWKPLWAGEGDDFTVKLEDYDLEGWYDGRDCFVTTNGNNTVDKIQRLIDSGWVSVLGITSTPGDSIGKITVDEVLLKPFPLPLVIEHALWAKPGIE